ncbi:substrate-binding periplasmic protein [Promicromonospora sp. Populi]|uniref:substrate-binding periplasmic protein n=1 Tax=Promicromonospora sp. Populi TaxID=3239420 RepID=UPI0034E2923C
MAWKAHRRTALLGFVQAWGPTAIILAVVVIATTIIVIGIRTAPPGPAKPVVISTSEWAPYVDPSAQSGGPVTEVVTEVLRRAGYQPEIRYTSWSLVESGVESGTSAAAFPLVTSASRSERFIASEPLVQFEYVLFYDRRAGEPEITTEEDLSTLRVGAVAGYDYWPEIDRAVSDWVEFDSTLSGFEALASGEIDVLAEGRVAGQALAAGPQFSGDAADIDYIRADSPLVRSAQGLHLMVARTDEAATFVDAFNRELVEFQQTEEYQELLGGLDGSVAALVELEPFTSDGLVELLDERGRTILLAPRGTGATVLDWPAEFTNAAAPESEPPLVQVKITTGPATGRVVFVDSRAITIGGEAQ